MALDESLILVANPGSASRKYALYYKQKCLLNVHFEQIKNKIYYSTNIKKEVKVNVSHISFVTTKLVDIIKTELPDFSLNKVSVVCLRIVAPSSYFQQAHYITPDVISRLESLFSVAPLHIGATLSEYVLLKKLFNNTKFVGVSDSQALSNKPDYAMYYGIKYSDSDKFDIKRFGYHGLSLQSVINTLQSYDKLAQRVVICHLGGGASIAGVKKGKIIDSTMGFSPLEGILMASRSGSIDILAYEQLKKSLKLNKEQMFEYLNSQGGLFGVSQYSSDIRELLKVESSNQKAKLALDMYVYKIRQAIGAMASGMGGVDALIFTGTVGVRSAVTRRRIVAKLLYLGFEIANNKPDHTKPISLISPNRNPAKIYVVNSREEEEMLKQVNNLFK
jgi:acetate kinase